MCGLILAPARFNRQMPDAMMRMQYRGPDGEGCASMGGWTLGHVRLAIQDLSQAGRQPFVSPKSATAFVGEFFTHQGSEPEYLHLLMTDPHTLLHEADGFWSIAQIDDEGHAAVFTDHLGIKPLYFWPQHSIVCSELEPMFKLAARPPLDETYLSNCIKWGYDCTGRTPYLGIQQLPPGAILHLEKNCAGMEIYWDWAKVPAPDLSLREIVEKAITNRLISDRPVAMLLSGGLDSSIIYYTLKNLGRQVEAFSVENGESEFLPEGIRTLPLAGVSLDEAVWTMQAPVDLGSLVPQVQLARAVAVAGYNVCLTGDGADELFGGYRRAKEYDSQKSDIFCELPYYHLPRLDRVMMRQTIELRSPFLAPSVVAYALRLPREYRTSKEALKYAFKGVVPDSIIERKKHPLKTPAVIAGGTAYRDTLVHTFRKHIREGAIA